MNIFKPCSYHYLFSHIPSYTSAAEARKTAEELVFRLVKDLQLTHDKMEQFETPHPDVLPLSFRADEDTQTYLLQFLSGDLITTILTFNSSLSRMHSLRGRKNDEYSVGHVRVVRVYEQRWDRVIF